MKLHALQKRIILMLVLIPSGLFLYGQVNLVPNPSFEERTGCPYWQPEFEHCNHWFNVSASNDYFHYCSLNPVLQLWMLSDGGEPPRTDSAMIASIPFAYNYREYPGVKLTRPLQNGSNYCLQLWISLVDQAGYHIDRFDAILTQTIPVVNHPVHPAIILASPTIILASHYLNKTDGWEKINGTYLATGGEEYLTLGIFSPTDSINMYKHDPVSGSSPYYFIDDVALYPCNAPVEVADAGPDRHVCLGDSVQVGSHELDEYRYYWYIDTLLVSREARPFFNPTQTTTYVLLVKDFKFDESWDTVTLHPVDCDTIPLGCPETEVFVCQGDSALLGCHHRADFLYDWVQPPDTYVFSTSGQIWVKPESSTTYILHTTDYTGRESLDTIRLTLVNCASNDIPLLIPNAFTPNGDGLNDYFEIIAPPGTKLQVLIFSRWGNQLFNGNQEYFWDGSYHNVPVPLGTYYYSITATLPPYRQTVVTGTVMVLR